MRKFFSLFLLLFVMILLPISASASEIDNRFGLDLMDYSTVNNSGSNFFSFTNTKTINIDIPNSYYTTYVEVIYNVSGGAAPTSVQSKWNSTLNSLTIENIGRGYYRAYGTVRVSTYYSLDLVFTTGNASSLTYIEIFSCIVRGNLIHFDINAALNYSAYSKSGIAYYYYTNSPPMTPVFITSDPTDYLNNQFQLFIYSSDWSKYDYLDYTVYCNVNSVTSITAHFGDIVLPIHVSYLDNNSSAASDFVFAVRIDIRGLDRTSNDYPQLIVAGDCITNSATNSFTILSAGAMLDVDFSDPAFPWYMKIYSHLSTSSDQVLSSLTNVLSAFDSQNIILNSIKDSIISSINSQNVIINSFSERVASLFDQYWGSTGAGAAAQGNAAQIKEDLTGGLDAASSFDKPSSSQVNRYLDFNGAISNTAILTSTGFLTAVFDVPVISKVLSLCMLFALAATILFGKR